MTYKDRQRIIAEELIEEGFFGGDKRFGEYRRVERPFVLFEGWKNLHSDISVDVIQYFKQNNIAWWGGHIPTGHTLSSQIACLNHLFPIRHDKNAVLALLKTVSDDFVDVLTINEHMPGYIQFEAVGGDVNFLNEKINTRGSNCTSVDALIYALGKKGRKFLIPIEWKYTEVYGNTNKSTEGNGKGEERLGRYSGLIRGSEFLNEDVLNCCWYEPFYQLMRQTLWVEKMIQNRVPGLEADDCLHIHVVPDKNAELLHRKYKCSGAGMEDTWRNCLKHPEKYVVISPERFWSGQNCGDLYAYLQKRYWRNIE